jgi:hypothetical protein
MSWELLHHRDDDLLPALDELSEVARVLSLFQPRPIPGGDPPTIRSIAQTLRLAETLRIALVRKMPAAVDKSPVKPLSIPQASPLTAFR